MSADVASSKSLSVLMFVIFEKEMVPYATVKTQVLKQKGSRVNKKDLTATITRGVLMA